MVRGTLEPMKLWNGYQWVDYDGTPQSGSVLAAREIVDTELGLDPAVKVITGSSSVDAVDAMHQRFAEMQEADTAEFVRLTRSSDGPRNGDREGDVVVVRDRGPRRDKLPGQLPVPRATFEFDTSEED